MPKSKPSAALFCCEPGECQDLYPPHPPPPRCCLTNPTHNPQKLSAVTQQSDLARVGVRVAGWVTRMGGTSSVPVSPRQICRPPGWAVPGCIAAVRIPDSFLGPAVSKGILILFFPSFPRFSGSHGAPPDTDPIFGASFQQAAAFEAGICSQRLPSELGGRKPPLAHAVTCDTHPKKPPQGHVRKSGTAGHWAEPAPGAQGLARSHPQMGSAAAGACAGGG